MKNQHFEEDFDSLVARVEVEDLLHEEIVKFFRGRDPNDLKFISARLERLFGQEDLVLPKKILHGFVEGFLGIDEDINSFLKKLDENGIKKESELGRLRSIMVWSFMNWQIDSSVKIPASEFLEFSYDEFGRDDEKVLNLTKSYFDKFIVPQPLFSDDERLMYEHEKSVISLKNNFECKDWRSFIQVVVKAVFDRNADPRDNVVAWLNNEGKISFAVDLKKESGRNFYDAVLENAFIVRQLSYLTGEDFLSSHQVQDAKFIINFNVTPERLVNILENFTYHSSPKINYLLKLKRDFELDSGVIRLFPRLKSEEKSSLPHIDFMVRALGGELLHRLDGVSSADWEDSKRWSELVKEKFGLSFEDCREILENILQQDAAEIKGSKSGLLRYEAMSAEKMDFYCRYGYEMKVLNNSLSAEMPVRQFFKHVEDFLIGKKERVFDSDEKVKIDEAVKLVRKTVEEEYIRIYQNQNDIRGFNGSGSTTYEFVNGIILSVKNVKKPQEEQRYPLAKLNSDGSISFLFDPDQSKDNFFEDRNFDEFFVDQIDWIINTYGFDRLSGKKNLLEVDKSELCLEYKFNIPIETFDAVLRHHSQYSYRNNDGLLSIKTSFDLDQNSIRFFPCVEIDGRINPRLTGCQVTELFALQLAHLLPEDKITEEIKVTHYWATNADQFGIGRNDYAEILNKIFKTAEASVINGINGFPDVSIFDQFSFILSDEVKGVKMVDIDDKVKYFYLIYGSVPYNELGHCKSCEIDTDVFLDVLKEYLNSKLESASSEERRNKINSAIAVIDLVKSTRSVSASGLSANESPAASLESPKGKPLEKRGEFSKDQNSQ